MFFFHFHIGPVRNIVISNSYLFHKNVQRSIYTIGVKPGEVVEDI